MDLPLWPLLVFFPIFPILLSLLILTGSIECFNNFFFLVLSSIEISLVLIFLFEKVDIFCGYLMVSFFLLSVNIDSELKSLILELNIKILLILFCEFFFNL